MKKPSAKGGRKHIDDDEEALWSHTAQSIEPLKRAKQRFHPAADRLNEDTPRTKLKSEIATSNSKHEKSRTNPPLAPSKVTVKTTPPIADFDRKKARKLRSGQVEIEARIDLHGMRQDEAHAALRAFLHRCIAKDQRWVLVITGKGKIDSRDQDDERPFDMTSRRDRGVLKRNVPRWLEEPDLRPLVVSYTTSAIQHGGEGALYIHLRTKRERR
ncbi:MAG: DNA mismatch repair protein MutS [Hyphomicrobium sp.]|nr:MAG: DNA mismatch repair protein MutS [Hyphomicrobium sp.]